MFTDINLDRVPPQSLEAEQCVLGAMLIERYAITSGMEIVQPEHFYREAHRNIYQGIIDLYTRKEPVDLVTLGVWLRDHDLLDEAGGVMYLRDCMMAVPTAAGIKHYATIVANKAAARELIRAGHDLIEQAYQDTATPAEMAEKTQKHLAGIGATTASRWNVKPLYQWEEDVLNRMLAADEAGADVGMRTGIPLLDTRLGVIQHGDMVVVAGRPSMGKSTLLGRMALSAAELDGQWAKTLLISCEMSAESLAARYLQAGADCEEPGRIRTVHGRQSANTDKLYASLRRQIASHKHVSYHLARVGGLTPRDLLRLIREQRDKVGVNLVLVDYLQLMNPDTRTKDLLEAVTIISKAIKEIAIDLNVPIIVASQLSRQVEQRPIKRPIMSDIRESGAIEQDADSIILIWRPGYYDGQWKSLERNDRGLLGKLGIDEQDTALTEMVIAKNRQGETGSFWMYFDMARQVFRELSPRNDTPASWSEKY